MSGVGLVAELTLRGLLRRRATLALLVVLPLALYVGRHALVGQSIRFLALGLAWAVSTAALFAAIEARECEARLRIGGWRRSPLLAGRVLGLLVLALTLAGAYLTLVWLDDRPVAHGAGIALLLAVTAVIAVGLGTALGAVVGRELEGALALFIVAGLQFVVDPAGQLAQLLPFWSTRELATYAVDGQGSAGAALAHALVAMAVLVALTAIASRFRGRRVGAAPAT